MPPKNKKPKAPPPAPVTASYGWQQYIHPNPRNPQYTPPAPPAPAAPAAPSGPTAAQQSAFQTLDTLLAEYGLTNLSGFARNLILSGTTDTATIMLQLQSTNEWKQRFSGNEMLRQQGLGVLSPAEYLSLERSYGQIMRNYGLPEGFYDDPSDFAKWIGNNVSAAEIQQRVSMYADQVNRTTSPEVQAQLQSMGWTSGDLLAAAMDPGRAMPLLQQRWDTIKLGAASRRAGYVANNDYLSGLAARGVTEEQASQGFGLVAQNLRAAQQLGLSGEELQAEIFDNDAGAANKRKRLASQERAQFGGSSGVAGGSLTRDTSGSY